MSVDTLTLPKLSSPIYAVKPVNFSTFFCSINNISLVNCIARQQIFQASAGQSMAVQLMDEIVIENERLFLLEFFWQLSVFYN
jgi:hypothetical protein